MSPPRDPAVRNQLRIWQSLGFGFLEEVRTGESAAPAEVQPADFAPDMVVDWGPVLPLEERVAALAAIAAEVAACQACRLCHGRTNTVPGEGDPMAPLMFIGEGPGESEDRTGRPFVGRAGELLTRIIGAMQFAREEVYIANVVKCRPPQNRQPEPDEMRTCLPYLERQIDLVRPRAIVLLGRTALMGLLPEHARAAMSAVRGNWLEYRGIPVMPTFHPAYLLRTESAKRAVWDDMKKVMKLLGKEPAAGKAGKAKE